MVTAPDIRASASTEFEKGPGIRFEIEVPKDLHYFNGHFPGCALLPGVVQITWAIELARRHLNVTTAFRGISALKFMRVIQPGDSVSLALTFDTAAGLLQFEYRRPSGVCASGVAQFG